MRISETHEENNENKPKDLISKKILTSNKIRDVNDDNKR